MTSESAHIYAVATAYPPHVMRQDDVAAKAAEVFGHKPDYFRRMAAAYGNAGVETRHSCVPLDWYLEQHGWPERTQLYEQNAIALLTEAGEACMAAANVLPADVAATVIVSSTGIVTPSLDSLLQSPLGLNPDVQRLPIFGFGCAGGVGNCCRFSFLNAALLMHRIRVENEALSPRREILLYNIIFGFGIDNFPGDFEFESRPA